jgi:hypothetical protein
VPAAPKDRVAASAFGHFGRPQEPPERVPAMPAVVEPVRKIVSRARPYLATHFTAASGVESAVSRQADQQRVGPWRCRGRRSKELDAHDLAAYGVVRTTRLHRQRYPAMREPLATWAGRAALCPSGRRSHLGQVEEAGEALEGLTLVCRTPIVCCA